MATFNLGGLSGNANQHSLLLMTALDRLSNEIMEARAAKQRETEKQHAARALFEAGMAYAHQPFASPGKYRIDAAMRYMDKGFDEVPYEQVLGVISRLVDEAERILK
jgi:hypothetical protein